MKFLQDTSYHSTLSKGSIEKKNSCADQIPFLSKIESQTMKPYFIHCIEAYSTPSFIYLYIFNKYQKQLKAATVYINSGPHPIFKFFYFLVA